MLWHGSKRTAGPSTPPGSAPRQRGAIANGWLPWQRHACGFDGWQTGRAIPSPLRAATKGSSPAAPSRSRGMFSVGNRAGAPRLGYNLRRSAGSWYSGAAYAITASTG
ncbi:hypothetical protein MTO96_016240 [Rhipicephalus appendiculatus]